MKTLLTLLLYACLTTIGLGQVQEIDQSTKFVAIQNECEVYSTTEDSIDILSVPSNLWSVPTTGLNFGMVREIKWVKFSVDNVTDERIKLNLYTPYHHIRSLIIYRQDSTSIVEMANLGTTQSYESKERETPGYCTQVNLPPGKTTFFFRIKHLNIPLRANTFLVSDKELDRIVHSSNGSYSIWYAIMLIGFILSLTFYLITKIRLFLIYLFLNIGIVLFIGMEVGLFFWPFDKDNWFALIDIKHLGDILVLIAFPYFLNELTPIRKHSPILWKITMALWWISLGSWMLGLIPSLKETVYFYYAVWFLIYFTIFVFVVQLFMLFKAFLKREKNSLILFVIYVLYIATVAFEVILPNVGIKSDSVYVYNLLLKSSMSEVVVFLGLMGREMYRIFMDRNALLEEQKDTQKKMLNAIVSSQ